MKKYKYPPFSNGSEFTSWMSVNCDRCVKSSKYNEKTDTYSKYRCAVNREIIEAYLDDGRTSKRTFDICQHHQCPNIQTEWKKYPKKDNQSNLFEV